MVRLHEHVQRKFASKREKVHQLPPFQRGDNEQDRVGAVGSCFIELDFVDHEFLVEGRESYCIFYGEQIAEASLKVVFVRQD